MTAYRHTSGDPGSSDIEERMKTGSPHSETANARVTLGVVAISRNEEDDLSWFLDNLVGWVDEIIVVDDGSTDRTREIAREASGNVVLVERDMTEAEGFAGQRNAGIAVCQSDWILNMDIDERVTPELAQEILEAIRYTKLNAFRFRRLNFFVHRPMKAGGWGSWNQPRIARRGYHRFVNRVHERCLVEGEPESVGQLTGLMWHLNDASYEERLRKSFLYSSIDAREIIENGFKVTWLDLSLRPMLEFFKKFFWLRGFRDGLPGMVAGIHSADAVFRTLALAWDIQNRIPRQDLEMELQDCWKLFPHHHGKDDGVSG